LGSNRDEYFERQSLSPARHWQKKPYIIGGLDKKAGGTWCAINDFGIVGCIHNRNINHKESKNTISRGEIILKILEATNIEEALKNLNSINVKNYNGFNIIIADKKNAYWAKHESFNKQLYIMNVPEGISILNHCDLNDRNNYKINHYLKMVNNNKKIYFDEKSNFPIELILSENNFNNQKNIYDSMCFNLNNKFGTVSSLIIGLNKEKKFSFYRYTDGPPDKSIYKNIDLL
tara:strand:- start:1676 stop:2371 length:696 start_codon:yes stop_codon:yes gene_type:complete